MTKPVHIIGGGLAGSECAFQLANFGFKVFLYEMRKIGLFTPAHKTRKLAELVCSNSFGSLTDYSAPGQLKWEAKKLGSVILESAINNHVPSGMALGVDRKGFSEHVNEKITKHPNIRVKEEVVTNWIDLEGYKVIATGPLTHPDLAKNMANHFGEDFLYFYDAIAPIVDTDSINMDVCFIADRYAKGTKDYINCPMSKEEYLNFIEALKKAQKMEFKDFEKTQYFDGCMPIEAIVERGDQTLRFGPLSGKGLNNSHYPEEDMRNRPYAVLQLRQDNQEATAYNLVGCQTKMTYPEQKRVFQMVPGLEKAEFLKLGSIHKNMFINSPKVLNKDLSSKSDPNLFFAGQITGVEGYFESTCTGLMVAHFIRQREMEMTFTPPPRKTAFGSLLNFLNTERENYQPMNINFSLLPPQTLTNQENKEIKKKADRKRMKRDKALSAAKEHFMLWFQATLLHMNHDHLIV